MTPMTPDQTSAALAAAEEILATLQAGEPLGEDLEGHPVKAVAAIIDLHFPAQDTAATSRERGLREALEGCLAAGVFSAPAIKKAKESLGLEVTIKTDVFSTPAGCLWSAWREGSNEPIGNGDSEDEAISDLQSKESLAHPSPDTTPNPP